METQRKDVKNLLYSRRLLMFGTCDTKFGTYEDLEAHSSGIDFGSKRSHG